MESIAPPLFTEEEEAEGSTMPFPGEATFWFCLPVNMGEESEELNEMVLASLNQLMYAGPQGRLCKRLKLNAVDDSQPLICGSKEEAVAKITVGFNSLSSNALTSRTWFLG